MKNQNISGSLPLIINNKKNRLYQGNLKHYFRTIFYSAENLNNPYHNFRHMNHVLYLCYRAAEYYFPKKTLSQRDVRNLLIAALFHDFNHTGKSGPDSENISRAIAGLCMNILPEDKNWLVDIIEIIQATEYPHKTNDKDINLCCQIIRDADKSQSFSIAWIQQVIFGLSHEWNKPDTPFTPQMVLERQDQYHKNLTFATAWARYEFPKKVIDKKLEEVSALLEILK